MRTHQHDEEEEFSRCFDSNGQLKPGIQKVTVPLKLIDAAPKRPDYYVRVEADIALARLPGFVRDNTAGTVSRTPKFVENNLDWLVADESDAGEYVRRRPKKLQERNAEGEEEGTVEVEDARQAAYDSYDQSVSTAWQGAEPLANVTGIGSHGFSGAVAGDRCTVRSGAGAYGPEGADGHLRLIGGELVCVADGHDLSAAKKPPVPQQQEIYDPAKGAVRPHGAGYDAKDHNAQMSQIYSELDASLRDAWRAK